MYRKEGVTFLLLKYAVKDFIDDRSFKNLSKHTIESYTLTLKEFQEFCEKNQIQDTGEISQNTVKQYFHYIKNEKQNKVGTINNKIRIVKAFFNFLIEESVLKENPAQKVKQIKQDLKIEVLSDQQIKQILKYFERRAWRKGAFVPTRNRMIVIFLLSTGVRKGELTNVRWDDIDFENLTIRVFGKKRQLASIPLATKLRKELAEYRLFCEKYFEYVPEYVFTNERGKQITPEAVGTMFKKLRKIMNFKDVRLSAHTFRHTFTHRAIMNGMDVFTLQKILRHENISQTQRYVAMWGTALQEQNERYNPLNNLDI